MTRSKFMLRLSRRATHRLGGHGQAMHAIRSIGWRELDLLNQQCDIDPELTGRFHLAARFGIPQSLDDAGQ